MVKIKQFKTFSLSLLVAALVCGLIWALAHSLSISKVPIQHPSPTGAYLSQFIGQKISPKRQDIAWLKITNKDSQWVDEVGAPLSMNHFQTAHTIVMAHGQGPTLALKLHRFFKKNELYAKTTILSSSDGFLKDLRYHYPDVAINYGQAFLIRLQAMERLSLSGFLKFDKDVAWINIELFPESTVSELIALFTKKKIPVLIGPSTKKVPKNWADLSLQLTE